MNRRYCFVILVVVITTTACGLSDQLTSGTSTTTPISTPLPPIVTPPFAIPTPTTFLEANANPTLLAPQISLPTALATLSSTQVQPTPILPLSLFGLSIAFTMDNKLWLWQDGAATDLTNLDGFSRVNISDDGRIIAFVRNGLWVIHSDGTNERLLVSDDDFRSMEPQDPGVRLNVFEWIPGTHKLIFNTILLLEYGLQYTDDLYLVDAEATQWRALLSPGEGGMFSVSPDGNEVAMITPKRIGVMKTDGSNYRTLLEYPSVLVPSEHDFYPQSTWATDSKSLTAVIPPEDVYYETASPTMIWRLPTDATPPTVVSQLPVGDLGVNNRIWAPDSQHYAIWSDESHSFELGNTSSDELIQLTEPSFVAHGFSWVDTSHFIYLGGQGRCELKLGTIGEPSILLAASETGTGCMRYDFVK